MLNSDTSYLNASKKQIGQQHAMLSKRFLGRVSLGTVWVLILAIGAVSYKVGTSKRYTEVSVLHGVISNLKTEVVQLQQNNAQIQQRAIAAERNYQIQIEAKKNLGDHLKALQEDNAELSQNVSLYQTVAGSPAIKQKGVQVKTFQIFSTEEANTFRYLMVLSKQHSSQEMIQGRVSMVIAGNIGLKPIFLPVKYVDSARDDGLGFKFRYLQELNGELTLPEGFIAKEVLLTVKSDTDQQDIQQQFPWEII